MSGRYFEKVVEIDIPNGQNKDIAMPLPKCPLHDFAVWVDANVALTFNLYMTVDGKTAIGAAYATGAYAAAKPAKMATESGILPTKYVPKVNLANASGSAAKARVIFMGHCRQPSL